MICYRINVNRISYSHFVDATGTRFVSQQPIVYAMSMCVCLYFGRGVAVVDIVRCCMNTSEWTF